MVVDLETSRRPGSGIGLRRAARRPEPFGAPKRRDPPAWQPNPTALAILVAACGLGICAWCEDLSRATLAPNPWIYWGGIVLIVAPLTYRATARRLGATERIALVALVGVGLYLAQLARDPYGYTVTDEFPHALNLEHIAGTHHLFHANVLLPITSHFPGLEGATSAIQSLTGMSSWGAGILFIGAARLLIMLAMYALFVAISRSARVAAIGAILFAANSNFMVFEGQFAYESLSLPLLVVTLACLAERYRANGTAEVQAWGAVLVAAILAIVPTHHLTSYLLDIILWLFSLRRLRLPRVGVISVKAGPRVWPFALFSTVLTFLWLVVVASQTVGYLSPEVTQAVHSTLRTITGGVGHTPFSNTNATVGSSNLITEEAAAFIEPVLLLIAVSFGLRAIWRRGTTEPLRWVLAVASVLFFADVVFKFVPSAWEISNRAGEFLFLGVSFIVGCSSLRWVKRFWHKRIWRAGFALGAAICVVGAAVSGLQANARLARPAQVEVAGATIESESEAVGRWFASQPPGLVAAPDADAFTINLYGHHVAYTGDSLDADNVLSVGDFEPWMLRDFRRAHIRYVVADARRRSTDVVTGVFFNLLPPAGPVDSLYKPDVVSKWAQSGARVYDSGDVVVYDLDLLP